MKFVIYIAVAVVSASAFGLRSERQPDVQISSRMANSQNANEGQIPYQVGLSLGNSSSPNAWCGGSLLNNQWVLTAGHCLRGRNSVIVYLGSTTRLQAEVKYKVDKKYFIIHPKMVDFPINNDIALINIPFTNYSKNIENVKLPAIDENYSSYEGENAIASGWGIESDSAPSVATLFNIISNVECGKFYTLFGIRPTVMCTSTSDGVSPCIGDSGGPLVLESNKIQVGIQSFVSAYSCTSGWPAGFTRVTSYLQWIRDHTGIFY